MKAKLILAMLGTTVLGCSIAPEPARAGGELKTVQVASGLNRPVNVVSAPGDTDRLFIIEQPGIIKILDLNTGNVLGTPFLNIDGVVSNGYTGNGERGLFALAFHPNYFVAGDPNEGNFFVHYSANSGATTIERYTVSNDPDVADLGSNLLIFTNFQPFANHNGGAIVFGPNDGYLYFGLGDGGSANDPGNRAQNDNQLLGKILRIDVNNSTVADPYDIPPSNPFVGEAPLDEIWAKGIRNPWRISFDRLNGDLYIADVGQNAREEINYQPADSPGGQNYGWRCMEGFGCTGFSGCVCNDDSLTLPIHEYFHNGAGGFSITGGYVYRGCQIPELFGHYFYADFVSNKIWTLKVVDGVATEIQERTADMNPPDVGGSIGQISTFGQDAQGELYIVERAGSGSGQVFRIEPKQPSLPGGDAPEIVHAGTNGALFSGYIDPRAESSNGMDVNLGLESVAIEFSEPIITAECTAVTADAFSVQVTGGKALNVISVDTSQNPIITVHLDGFVPLQEWATIIANVHDFEGNQIPSSGNQGPGVNETDRIDVASLPGDVTQDGMVQPVDLLRFRQIITGVLIPPQGTPEDFVDTDRNGSIQPLDFLRFRQLILGTGNATRNWSQPPNNTMLSDQP